MVTVSLYVRAIDLGWYARDGARGSAMLPASMTDPALDRRQMRILAAALTALWAATAVAVAAAYRPGGPLDIFVAVVCFGPAVVAAAGLSMPALPGSHRSKVALVWIWIGAVLLAIPVLYGVASTLAAGGPQNLVPSAEAAYAGLLAVSVMTVFSVTGSVHGRRGAVVFERRAAVLTVGLAALITAVLGVAFGLVAIINDQALRQEELPRSSYGPTDPDLVPPFCDEPVALGPFAVITISARSSLDDEARGTALLSGERRGIDESWRGSWSGPDGEGTTAYLRIGRQAWLNEGGEEPAAPDAAWQETRPNPFALAGHERLTMDGPVHARVAVPRGSIVAEDLGLEVIEGARARHCRTFMDGAAALSTFLPLRWLLLDSHDQDAADVPRWRGEMDWWVFGDGELGRARVEISGSRADTSWDATGVRAVLEAELEAVERDQAIHISAPDLAAGASPRPALPRGAPPAASPRPALPSGAPPAPALESAAP